MKWDERIKDRQEGQERQEGQKNTKRINAGKTWDEREAANKIEEGVYFTWRDRQNIQTKWEIEMRKS
jgi:hypothetical protein